MNPLTTPRFIHLEQSFARWLRLLNFEPSTVRYAPRKVSEFFCWLEKRHITELSAITRPVIGDYFSYLETRQNKKKNGRLSKNYPRAHLTALRKLARYLRETGRESFEVDICLGGTSRGIKTIFTRAEISILYKSCEGDILGIRDRAMLAVYYGCGLRRNEGISLDVGDIFPAKNLLYVSKGKNYKSRFVPLTESVKEDLLEYIEYARPILIKSATNALFLSSQGSRITANMMAHRLQQLKAKAGIDKPAGLHTLRHSIATHLLHSGMELVQIKRFLGHGSLESTQIYTHVAHETG